MVKVLLHLSVPPVEFGPKERRSESLALKQARGDGAAVSSLTGTDYQRRFSRPASRAQSADAATSSAST